MSAAPGSLLERFADQEGNLFIGDRSWAAWAELLVKPLETPREIALAPETDGLLAKVKMLGDSCARQAIGGHEDQTDTLDEAAGQGTEFCQGTQFETFLIAEDDGIFGSTSFHGSSQ